MNTTNDNQTKTTKSLRQEAEDELREERLKEAKAKIKGKLRALNDARQVVKNLEVEVADLEREIENGL